MKSAVFSRFQARWASSKMATCSGGGAGSGWAWLAVDKDKKLTVFNTPYQDTPHMDVKAKPILGIEAEDSWSGRLAL